MQGDSGSDLTQEKRDTTGGGGRESNDKDASMKGDTVRRRVE